MPFQDYRQFIDLCDQSTLEDRAKMAEFYLYNMAITNMNVWDPNAKLGDVQLMALALWMNHEDSRATKMKRILPREKTEPLLIRAEQSNPMALINTHNLIAIILSWHLDILLPKRKQFQIFRTCSGC